MIYREQTMPRMVGYLFNIMMKTFLEFFILNNDNIFLFFLFLRAIFS